jgi:phage shock protein PspC (stress-responsive transcriptional regulator)
MSALHRSRNQKIAGVCAGLAESWGIDVSKMRIAFAVIGVLSLFSATFSAGISTGFLVVMYLLMWWLLPVMDTEDKI